MEDQIIAWNTGDLDGFMEGYIKSEKLEFVGSKGVTYGWEQTLKNYHKSYPDAASRGILKFDIIKLERLSGKAYFMIGKYHLTRPEKGDASGHFTLLWKKIKGKWVIVTDHTS